MTQRIGPREAALRAQREAKYATENKRAAAVAALKTAEARGHAVDQTKREYAAKRRGRKVKPAADAASHKEKTR